MTTRSIYGSVFVITGASSGIGRCAALHMASRGARVVVTARRLAVLDDLVRQIERAGGTALAIAGDVTSEADQHRVAREAVDRFGGIDVWVNNAAVYLQGRVQDLALGEYRRIMEVDFLGVVNGTRAALEVMLPRRHGTIIQVSSISAKRGVPFASAYSAAKAAIDGFTSAVRSELLGSGIRICTLYPPTVDTPIYHQARGLLGVVPKPAPPVADPEQAAHAIERLAITGDRYGYFGWSRALSLFDAVAPAAGDWLLHHGRAFTYSDLPADGDNLYAPSTTVPATIRAGWREKGWKGATLRETVRVLPVESAIAGAAAIFFFARIVRAAVKKKAN